MPRYNEKEKIREHYDVVSPYYISLWGNHIHHGFWIRGDESKEQAQLQLIDHLAEAADLPRGCSLLDIGCGFGGSSIYLSKKFNVRATGITISPVQVDLASRAAKQGGANAVYLRMDAEAMNFSEPFDVLWSVESISHYQDLGKFFASASKLVKPGGAMAITDWFKKGGLTAAASKKTLGPIEKGMLIELHTMKEYEDLMEKNGLRVTRTEVLNKECAKTWDISLDIIKKKELWAIAASHGIAFLHFLRSFKAMRAGFASGNFVYGLIVARKP